MAVERIELLGVPVDVCPVEDLEKTLLDMEAKSGAKQIVFLSIWDLLKARNKKSNLHGAVQSADLILPISKSILKGAKFLGLPVPARYNPFDATIRILSILDANYRSVFLFGGRKRTLMTAERNVHLTFHGLQVIGRYVGYYPKALEKDIEAAIHKAAPSLVLLSEGIKEKNCWAYNRRELFSTSIFLYYQDIFGIFAKRIKRVSEKTFERGMEIWSEILHNPLKFFFVFPYIRYILLLVWNRLFAKKTEQA